MEKKDILELSDFFIKSDISETICRAAIYSYHPEPQEPIIFRHYLVDMYSQGMFGSINGRGYYSMFFYISGDLNFITSTHIYNLSYGDIFISKEWIPFSSKNMSDSTINFYEIDIPLSFFELVPEADFFKNIFFEKNGTTRHFLSLNGNQRESCISKLGKIEELFSGNEDNLGIVAYSYIIQIFRILNENIIYENEKLSAPANAPECIIKALEYIQSNFIKISCIDEISAICHVSTSYLSRTFKAVLGTSIYCYIQSMKIAHSKFLLKNGHNVTSACFNSGFKDYSHYIQTFKKAVGMTPHKYKQTIIE